MRYLSKLLTGLLAGALLAPVLGGCAPAPADRPRSLQETAGAEATAILQRAEATAIVLRAQAAATALIRSAGAPTEAPQATPKATPVPTRPSATLEPGSAAFPQPGATARAAAPAQAAGPRIAVLGVGLAADGAFVIVNFRAPPQAARTWVQGSVYVVDEGSGAVYDHIPVMPAVGPLFGRPKEAGQPGYVMFTNEARGLQPGSIVSVVLGDFKQEHVTVQ